MPRKPYGMICPITRVCEILEPRWTIPIIVALWAGASKFNEIRREIGSISPALLSKRLKELEALGLIARVDDKASGTVNYIRTDMALALEPALTALAHWGQQNVDAETAMCTASASNLMWKMRKYFVAEEFPPRRVVIQFHFADVNSEYHTYWALIRPHAPVEICTSIPGYDIDVYIETSVQSLLGILLGRSTVARETSLGTLYLSGDQVLSKTMDRWLELSEYSTLDAIEKLPNRRQFAPLSKAHSGEMAL